MGQHRIYFISFFIKRVFINNWNLPIDYIWVIIILNLRDLLNFIREILLKVIIKKHYRSVWRSFFISIRYILQRWGNFYCWLTWRNFYCWFTWYILQRWGNFYCWLTWSLWRIMFYSWGDFLFRFFRNSLFKFSRFFRWRTSTSACNRNLWYINF